MVKIIVDLDKCNGDGVCIEMCPGEVFELQTLAEYQNMKKSIPVRTEDCLLCEACVASCPTEAITVKDE